MSVVIVLNVTPHSVDLDSFDGDSVTVPAGAQVPVDSKFVTWKAPNPNQIKVLSPLPNSKTTQPSNASTR